MVEIVIEEIGDKIQTYKLLREYTDLSISDIKAKIESHAAVMSVNDLSLGQLKKARKLIQEFQKIATEVTIKDNTGRISLELLDNRILSYQGTIADTEWLDSLMFDDD